MTTHRPNTAILGQATRPRHEQTTSHQHCRCGYRQHRSSSDLARNAFSSNKDFKPVTTTIHDPGLVVTRFDVTQGTNHLLYRGNPLLARLNRALTHFSLGSIGDARQWTKTTLRDSCVLCIGYNPGASPGLVPGGIAARFTNRRGDTVLFLEEHTFMLDLKNNSCLTIWSLPALFTNYAGCELHLVTKSDGKKLVSFGL